MAKEKKYFCANCKEEIFPSSKICPFCNAPVVQTDTDKPKKRKKRALGVIVVLIWVILALAIVSAGLWIIYRYAFTSFDCKELLSVHFDGSNHYGIGYVTFNEDLDLFTATQDGAEGTPKLSDVFDTDTERAKEIQELLRKSIFVADDPRDETYKTTVDGIIHTGTSLSKKDNIKNGDVIKVEVSYDSWAFLKKGVRLENTEFDIKVTGLTNSSTLDPFKDLKYIFTGVEGYGKVSVDMSGCSDMVLDNFDFSVSPNTNLSEGDTVTVTAKYKGNSYDEQSGTIEYGGHFYSVGKESRKSITVGRLNAINTLDPFENVEVIFDGIDPYLRISGYDTSKSLNAINTYFDFEADVTENLKAGQVIRVRVVYKTVDGRQYNDSDLLSAGYVLLKDERTYTVPENVSKYIAKSGDFDQNKLAESFRASLTPYMKNQNKVKLINSYLGIKKDKNKDIAYNKYYEVYQINTQSSTLYMVFAAENIYKLSDGRLNYNVLFTEETNPDKEVLMDKYIRSCMSDYDLTEIKTPASPVNNYNITTTTTTTATTKKADGTGGEKASENT